MRIISFIEEEDLIQKILKHLNLWITGNHDPPHQAKTTGGTQFSNIFEIDFDVSSQIMQEELIPQMPYENEYSQVIPYDDCLG